MKNRLLTLLLLLVMVLGIVGCESGNKENNKPVQGELAITFADSFKDL